MTDNQNIVKEFLNKCSIEFEDFNHLDGMLIPRETLISNDKYDIIKEDIVKMKKLYSSGSLTALQKNAKENQKWPLLNLVRQLLKVSGYHLKPVRKSAGYDEHGKKLFKRFFIIEKIKKPEVDKIKTE